MPDHPDDPDATTRAKKPKSDGDPPKRTLTDDDVVIRRSTGARSVVAVRGAQVEPPNPNDPTRRGVGHGDPDH